MILDKGVLTVFREKDMAISGEMPRRGYDPIDRKWYGELNFETSPARPTEGRTELRTDARVRIHQNRGIRQNDVVILRNLYAFDARHPDDPVYRVTRAWHGADETGATLITDLSLEVFTP